MEVILELNEALDTAMFYGVNNNNILCLRNQHPDVRVVARGYQVKVIGSQPAIARFEQNMRKCEAFCIRQNTINEEQILQLLHGEQPNEFLQDNLILHTTGLVKTEKLKLSLKEKSIGCLSWSCKQVILVNVAFSLIKRNESPLYLKGP